jgi:hypothetical protein
MDTSQQMQAEAIVAFSQRQDLLVQSFDDRIVVVNQLQVRFHNELNNRVRKMSHDIFISAMVRPG